MTDKNQIREVTPQEVYSISSFADNEKELKNYVGLMIQGLRTKQIEDVARITGKIENPLGELTDEESKKLMSTYNQNMLKETNKIESAVIDDVDYRWAHSAALKQTYLDFGISEDEFNAFSRNINSDKTILNLGESKIESWLKNDKLEDSKVIENYQKLIEETTKEIANGTVYKLNVNTDYGLEANNSNIELSVEELKLEEEKKKESQIGDYVFAVIDDAYHPGKDGRAQKITNIHTTVNGEKYYELDNTLASITSVRELDEELLTKTMYYLTNPLPEGYEHLQDRLDKIRTKWEELNPKTEDLEKDQRELNEFDKRRDEFMNNENNDKDLNELENDKNVNEPEITNDDLDKIEDEFGVPEKEEIETGNGEPTYDPYWDSLMGDTPQEGEVENFEEFVEGLPEYDNHFEQEYQFSDDNVPIDDFISEENDLEELTDDNTSGLEEKEEPTKDEPEVTTDDSNNTNRDSNPKNENETEKDETISLQEEKIKKLEEQLQATQEQLKATEKENEKVKAQYKNISEYAEQEMEKVRDELGNISAMFLRVKEENDELKLKNEKADDLEKLKTTFINFDAFKNKREAKKWKKLEKEENLYADIEKDDPLIGMDGFVSDKTNNNYQERIDKLNEYKDKYHDREDLVNTAKKAARKEMIKETGKKVAPKIGIGAALTGTIVGVIAFPGVAVGMAAVGGAAALGKAAKTFVTKKAFEKLPDSIKMELQDSGKDKKTASVLGRFVQHSKKEYANKQKEQFNDLVNKHIEAAENQGPSKTTER